MVEEADMYDPWHVPAGGFSPNAEDGDPIRIETIENVEPLDRQFGISPKKTVPDALREVIFGQPEPTQPEIEMAGGDPANVPSMRTYAILDAAKVSNLPELLGASGLEHRCLFKGNAYDDLKDVAPWLVRLEEGNDFTRRLFTGPDGINGLWDKEPGIYVQSRRTLDDIFRHFRRFTRLRDKKDQWRYFRFWDPEFFTIASMFAKVKRYDISIIIGRTITLSSVGKYIIDSGGGGRTSSRDREDREMLIFNKSAKYYLISKKIKSHEKEFKKSMKASFVMSSFVNMFGNPAIKGTGHVGIGIVCDIAYASHYFFDESLDVVNHMWASCKVNGEWRFDKISRLRNAMIFCLKTGINPVKIDSIWS